MFCFICVQQNAKLNLRAARNKELAFISEGFSNWKKTLTRFKEHQLSDCHKLAIDCKMNFPTTCGNVLKMSNDAAPGGGGGKMRDPGTEIGTSAVSLRVFSHERAHATRN